MKDKDLNLEENEISHTLGGSGEGDGPKVVSRGEGRGWGVDDPVISYTLRYINLGEVSTFCFLCLTLTFKPHSIPWPDPGDSLARFTSWIERLPPLIPESGSQKGTRQPLKQHQLIRQRRTRSLKFIQSSRS